MMNDIIRVGIAGCGGISNAHIPVLMALEGVEIRAVCDINPERAEKAAARTGAEVCRDFGELIGREDIDVVHVLTPHYLHAPLAIAALKAGKTVITEKPMATTLEDARAMVRAARESTGRLGVIFQNRYNPASIALKKLVASGEAGKFLGSRAIVCWHREAPYYNMSGWRGFMATEGGGTLINQSIHTLDLLTYVAGRRFAKVRGHVSTDVLDYTVEVETSCHAVAEYADGARSVIYVTNDYAYDAPIVLEMACENRTWQIVGDKLYDVTGGKMELLLDGAPPAVSDKAYWGSGHAAELSDFYDCIRTGRPFMLEDAEAYAALNLVKAIQESSATGKWVELDDPEEI